MIVAYQNQIVMEETLDAALERLFGEPARPARAAAGRRRRPRRRPRPRPRRRGRAAGAAGDADPSARRRGAGALRARAAAQRDGNWALYGEEIKKLGEVLKKLP